MARISSPCALLLSLLSVYEEDKTLEGHFKFETYIARIMAEKIKTEMQNLHRHHVPQNHARP